MEPSAFIRSGAGFEAVKAAVAVVPITLIVIFLGVLWLLGLACGEDRRKYVADLSTQARETISVLRGAATASRSAARRRSALPSAREEGVIPAPQAPE